MRVRLAGLQSVGGLGAVKMSEAEMDNGNIVVRGSNSWDVLGIQVVRRAWPTSSAGLRAMWSRSSSLSSCSSASRGGCRGDVDGQGRALLGRPIRVRGLAILVRPV